MNTPLGFITPEWMTLIWGAIIMLALYAYVIMDGFDLGLGLLFALYPERADRDVLMNSVAPVWDGNETWLVLGGGGLFAAFPLAYSILMPALYAPVIAMLLGLIFRGVAFEYRWRSTQLRWVWDCAFIGGSLVAALSQGIVLGAIVQGVAVSGREYAGGWWDWLTPFSVTTGIAVVVGYLLLGSTWLIMKTTGPIQDKARNLAWRFGLATLAFVVMVSIWTPLENPLYWSNWFTWPNRLITLAVPVLIGIISVAMFRSLRVHRHEYRPFVLSLVLFGLCFIGLGISLYPTIVPPDITLIKAAAPPKSQAFMLVGVIFTLPLIIGYTAYAYWIFRGKIDPERGYH